MKNITTLLFVFFILTDNVWASDLPEKHGAIDAQLFIGKGENQPLMVGFGGGEGGNAWASDHWQETRNEFLKKGYAFLAIGYFGMPNTTQMLDKIPLDAIHQKIIKAGKNPKINSQKIALIGGSKGAELVLNLASRYPEISSVVAIVPSHVSFPGLTYTMDHSSWTFNGKEVPYVQATERIIPAALNREHHKVFSIMLEDGAGEGVEKARIPVEKINGTMMIISAREDEMWPSLMMSEQLVERLKQAKFTHHFEHIIAEGDHASSLNHFPEIFAFLEAHYKML